MFGLIELKQELEFGLSGAGGGGVNFVFNFKLVGFKLGCILKMGFEPCLVPVGGLQRLGFESKFSDHLVG